MQRRRYTDEHRSVTDAVLARERQLPGIDPLISVFIGGCLLCTSPRSQQRSWALQVLEQPRFHAFLSFGLAHVDGGEFEGVGEEALLGEQEGQPPYRLGRWGPEGFIQDGDRWVGGDGVAVDGDAFAQEHQGARGAGEKVGQRNELGRDHFSEGGLELRFGIRDLISAI